MADARTARLTAALAGAGVSWDQVAVSRLMTGGTFNAVHLVSLADGTRLVVKIPPGPETPLLRYEQGILATEALYYQLAGQCSGVTVPEVVAVDGADAAGGYLVMTECPGNPWPELAPRPHGTNAMSSAPSSAARWPACTRSPGPDSVTRPGRWARCGVPGGRRSSTW